MNEYNVTLTATSIKEFSVVADSHDEAYKLAEDIFFNSDLADFTDEDIVGIDVDVEENDEDFNEVYVNEAVDELTEFLYSASKKEVRLFIEKLRLALNG